MGSIIDYIECPNCKNDAVLDFYYKTAEEYMLCDHCGYSYSIILKNRDKALNELVEEDWEKNILENPYGCVKIKYFDSFCEQIITLSSKEDFFKLKSEAKKIDIEKLTISRFINGKISLETIIDNSR